MRLDEDFVGERGREFLDEFPDCWRIPRDGFEE
jgi:hypothetical protein